MTTNSGEAPIQDRIDPMVEALMKGLIGTASHPKAAARTEDAIEAALAEAFMASLIPQQALSHRHPHLTKPYLQQPLPLQL